jgi:hypothetical protein
MDLDSREITGRNYTAIEGFAMGVEARGGVRLGGRGEYDGHTDAVIFK